MPPVMAGHEHGHTRIRQRFVQVIHTHVHNKHLMVNRRTTRVRRSHRATNFNVRFSSLILRNIIITTRFNNRRRSITFNVQHTT